MNAVSKMNGNPTEQLRQQLTKLGPELKNALPSNIAPEKFQRVVLTVVNLNPELLSADRKTLLGACMRCAADGLVPDGREAALTVFGGKVQYLPMIAGLLKRVRNSGEISTIAAHVIYEHDEFLVELGDEERIVHKPAWNKDRGRMVGVYAVAKLKDGGMQRALLSATDVEKVRAVSRTKNTGPWVQWPEAMWQKTALRRLTKYLPMDAETERMERMLQRDDEPPAAIEGEAMEIADSPQIEHSSKLDVIEGGLSETLDETLDGDRIGALEPDPEPPPPPPARKKDTLREAVDRIKAKLSEAADQDGYNAVMGDSSIASYWKKIVTDRPELAEELEQFRQVQLDRIAAEQPA